MAPPPSGSSRERASVLSGRRRSTSTRPARCSCWIRSTGECCVGRVARSTRRVFPSRSTARLADLAVVRRRLALRPRVGRATRARRPAGSPLRRDGTRARRRRSGRAVALADPHGAGWADGLGASLAPVDADGARRLPPPAERAAPPSEDRPSASIGRRGDRPSHGERASSRRGVWRPHRALLAADERDAARRGAARGGDRSASRRGRPHRTPRAPTSSGSSFSIGAASAQQFAVASADWAETAPLSRFRLVGRSLYQLGSNAAGAFVDRYDLEVR